MDTLSSLPQVDIKDKGDQPHGNGGSLRRIRAQASKCKIPRGQYALIVPRIQP
ncbi:13701_t:CDS:2, partial [Dentiscutata erythropus]